MNHSQIQFMPDEQLSQEMQNPSGMMPQWIALAELNRRQRLRSQQPVPQQQGTVADDVMKQLHAAGMQTMNDIDPMSSGLMTPQQQAPPAAPQGMRNGGAVHFADGGNVGMGGGGGLAGLAPQPQPLDPSQYQMQYTPPQQMNLGQAQQALGGIYGQSPDYGQILQQIQQLRGQQTGMSDRDAMRMAGLAMMSSHDPNPIASIGAGLMGAYGAQQESRQQALKNQEALLGMQAQIQVAQSQRADKISDAVVHYQENQNKSAEEQARFQAAVQEGNLQRAMGVAERNESLKQGQAKAQLDYMKALGDPSNAGIASTMAHQQLAQDPTNPNAKAAADLADQAQATDWSIIQRLQKGDIDKAAAVEKIKTQGEIGVASAKLGMEQKALAKNPLMMLAAAGGDQPGQPGALDAPAQAWLLTGNAGLPVRGKEGTALLGAVTARANQIMAEKGITADELQQIRSNYKSNSSELGKLQTQYGQVQSYEQNVEKQMPLLQQASDKVWRTGSPFLNQFIVPAERSAGVAGTKSYHDYLATLAPEYAKVMNGFQGQTTDGARAHAQEILNEGLSKGNLQEAFNVLRNDMGLRIGSMRNEISAATTRQSLDGLHHFVKSGQFPTATMNGVDATAGIGGGAAPAPAAGGAQRVRMMSPDGRSGSALASDVPELLKRGYKQAQ